MNNDLFSLVFTSEEIDGNSTNQMPEIWKINSSIYRYINATTGHPGGHHDTSVIGYRYVLMSENYYWLAFMSPAVLEVEIREFASCRLYPTFWRSSKCLDESLYVQSSTGSHWSALKSTSYHWSVFFGSPLSSESSHWSALSNMLFLEKLHTVQWLHHINYLLVAY